MLSCNINLLLFHCEMSQAWYFFGLNGIHPNPVPTRGGCSKLNPLQRSMPCHIFYWLISGIICIRLLFVRNGTNNKNQAMKFQMAPVLHTFSSVSNRDFLTLSAVTNCQLQSVSQGEAPKKYDCLNIFLHLPLNSIDISSK